MGIHSSTWHDITSNQPGPPPQQCSVGDIILFCHRLCPRRSLETFHEANSWHRQLLQVTTWCGSIGVMRKHQNILESKIFKRILLARSQVKGWEMPLMVWLLWDAHVMVLLKVNHELHCSKRTWQWEKVLPKEKIWFLASKGQFAKGCIKQA